MISIGNNTKIKNSIIGSKNDKEIKKLHQELERKDNIINELEKWLIVESSRLHKMSGDNFTTVGQCVYESVLDKLKELKENK